MFRPDTTTLWDRITHPFAQHAPQAPFDPVYTFGADSKNTILPPPPFIEKSCFEYDKPRLLLKPSERPIARLHALARKNSGRKREAVKFRPLSEATVGALSSDEDDDSAPFFPTVLRRQDTNRTLASATKTLTNGFDVEFDYDKERAVLFRAKKGSLAGSETDAVPEYSDYEEDVTASTGKKRGAPGWTPPFMERKQSSLADSSTLAPVLSNDIPPGAVPLTPSLIHAIDRIAAAQSDAFTSRSRDGLPLAVGSCTPLTPSANDDSKGEHWDIFWRDVTTKAGQRA
jgi:hypothetical protein